jgi:hypothetical protein
MTLTDLTKHLDFHSNTWVTLKAHLVAEEQKKIALLIGTDSQDKSNELKGAIRFIRTLLKAEEDARKGL